MKRYPHPGYPFKCASSDCAFHVHTPGRKCAMCESSEIGPMETAFYRWFIRMDESISTWWNVLKWFPRACVMLLVVGIIYLIAISFFSAAATYHKING
jgi:ABC-type multidrug transport system permease subunit